MLDVSPLQTTARTAPLPTPADDAGTSKPTASPPQAHPEGLAGRPSAAGDAPPRASLASLPGDIQRHIGQQLDARSMVAFASTNRATHAALSQTPAHGQIGRLFPGIGTAQSAADFAHGFNLIRTASQTHVRTEALEALALRFVQRHAGMPPMEALEAREALVGTLKEMPAEPGSGRALATATHAAFESVRHMTRTAFQLTQDPGDVAPQDRQRVLEECEAVLEAATRDHFALNDVVNAHGLATHRGAMARLVDESFGDASTPLVMQFASIMVPLRLSKLEAGSVASDHVVGVLTHLAQAEARPAAHAALHAMEWAPVAAAKIQAALDAHGIDPVDHPALHGALQAITHPAS